MTKFAKDLRPGDRIRTDCGAVALTRDMQTVMIDAPSGIELTFDVTGIAIGDVHVTVFGRWVATGESDIIHFFRHSGVEMAPTPVVVEV